MWLANKRKIIDSCGRTDAKPPLLFSPPTRDSPTPWKEGSTRRLLSTTVPAGDSLERRDDAKRNGMIAPLGGQGSIERGGLLLASEGHDPLLSSLCDSNIHGAAAPRQLVDTLTETADSLFSPSTDLLVTSPFGGGVFIMSDGKRRLIGLAPSGQVSGNNTSLAR